jgi:prepilin-type N-terminal cleavage/methylation domain-containing protein
MSFRRSPAGWRGAFTLVELVIVMAIIVTVAAITALVLPDILRSDKLTQGTNLIQGMLLAARQRAIRDQVPSGVRFYQIADPVTNPGVNSRIICTEAVYVEKPDDFVITTDKITLNGSGMAQAASADFSGGIYLVVSAANAVAEEFPVQFGDYLVINNQASMITCVSQSAGTRYDTLSVLNTGNFTSTPTGTGTAYSVQRAPRRVRGEDSVKFPSDIVVLISDTAVSGTGGTIGCQNIPTRQVNVFLNGNTTTPVSTANFTEIVFSPTGAVIGTNNNGSNPGQMIKLWVWDSSRDTPTNGAANYLTGQASYVVVSPLTGMIVIQPVNTTGSPSYDSYTTDLHLSGM